MEAKSLKVDVEKLLPDPSSSFFFHVVLFSLLGFRFFSRYSSSPPTDYEV